MAKGEPTAMKGTAGYVPPVDNAAPSGTDPGGLPMQTPGELTDKHFKLHFIFEFKMGQHVRDEVTGYMGTIVARCQYMAASSRYQVQANGLAADGAMVKAYWFDEGRLEAL